MASLFRAAKRIEKAFGLHGGAQLNVVNEPATRLADEPWVASARGFLLAVPVTVK